MNLISNIQIAEKVEEKYLNKKAVDVFKEFDSDGNGIDKKELGSIFKDGTKLNSLETFAAQTFCFDELDGNKDGKIDEDELLNNCFTEELEKYGHEKEDIENYTIEDLCNFGQYMLSGDFDKLDKETYLENHPREDEEKNA